MRSKWKHTICPSRQSLCPGGQNPCHCGQSEAAIRNPLNSRQLHRCPAHARGCPECARRLKPTDNKVPSWRDLPYHRGAIGNPHSVPSGTGGNDGEVPFSTNIPSLTGRREAINQVLSLRDLSCHRRRALIALPSSLNPCHCGQSEAAIRNPLIIGCPSRQGRNVGRKRDTLVITTRPVRDGMWIVDGFATIGDTSAMTEIAERSRSPKGWISITAGKRSAACGRKPATQSLPERQDLRRHAPSGLVLVAFTY
jgi:hypothetical protein